MLLEIEKKLEEMYSLQKELNDSTNGKNWELGQNKFGKEINWLRCVHMEVSELIESTPWKHWKNINADADIENIKIELVDIWHFLMSYVLQETNIPKAVVLSKNYCKYTPVSKVSSKQMIEESEKLSYLALAIQNNKIDLVNETIQDFIEQFFKCCEVCGLSFDWLHRLYIGKNCLNKFRQDNGYKEGTYIKIWNGKEDNVVMVEILESLDDIKFETLYNQLHKAYQSL